MTKDGKHILVERDTTHPVGCEITPVLSVLETQLAELDRIGSTIAAAHLDAAIQQLRLDQIKGSVKVKPNA